MNWTDAQKPAPFAVLRLSDLRLFRFSHKDDMQEAIRAMRERSQTFVAMIYHPEASTYVVPEVMG